MVVQDIPQILIYLFLFIYLSNVTKLYNELRSVLGLEYTEENKKDV